MGVAISKRQVIRLLAKCAQKFVFEEAQVLRAGPPTGKSFNLRTSTMNSLTPCSAIWTSAARRHRMGADEHAGLAILDTVDRKSCWG